jgi:hypothetical protein
MRVLRGLGGAVLWIVASVVGLLAVVLCVTVILLPVGIPLLLVAKRMFGKSVGLLLPRAVTHPVDEGSKKMRKSGKDVSTKAGKASKASRKKAGKVDKAADKRFEKLAAKGGEKIGKADKVGKRGDKKLAKLAKEGGAKARELAGGKKRSRLPWKR